MMNKDINHDYTSSQRFKEGGAVKTHGQSEPVVEPKIQSLLGELGVEIEHLNEEISTLIKIINPVMSSVGDESNINEVPPYITSNCVIGENINYLNLVVKKIRKLVADSANRVCC